jgi:hypothetical protein
MYTPTTKAANAWSDCPARSLCDASCGMSCPPASNAFGTTGCWPCKCRQSTHKQWDRPKRLWRASSSWMCQCVHAARMGGCMSP